MQLEHDGKILQFHCKKHQMQFRQLLKFFVGITMWHLNEFMWSYASVFTSMYLQQKMSPFEHNFVSKFSISQQYDAEIALL